MFGRFKFLCSGPTKEKINKPKTYPYQATVEHVNAGKPYYVGSVEFGYQGKHQPIAETVSNHAWFKSSDSAELDYDTVSEHLWVTCTQSRHQFNNKYSRCSLKDDGVIHQNYSDKMAFTTEEAAIYYSKTGNLLKDKNMTIEKLETGMFLVLKNGKIAQVFKEANCVAGDEWMPLEGLFNNSCDQEYSILKVYKPLSNRGYSIEQFKKALENNTNFSSNLSWECVWEFEDKVEELTLEQVCKELGRDIKIIK